MIVKAKEEYLINVDVRQGVNSRTRQHVVVEGRVESGGQGHHPEHCCHHWQHILAAPQLDCYRSMSLSRQDADTLITNISGLSLLLSASMPCLICSLFPSRFIYSCIKCREIYSFYLKVYNFIYLESKLQK